MGHVKMGRMIWIVGLVYGLCALGAGSPRPGHWSGFVQAAMLVIAGSIILMIIENDIAGNVRRVRSDRGSRSPGASRRRRTSYRVLREVGHRFF